MRTRDASNGSHSCAQRSCLCEYIADSTLISYRIELVEQELGYCDKMGCRCNGTKASSLLELPKRQSIRYGERSGELGLLKLLVAAWNISGASSSLQLKEITRVI